ncbi:hypothetical protein QBC45DRAFT_186561 [Copromyces sp. CBS 386.78]|nr:hypothetical protein QBC45DRAFT_186561 [Copromyces sp. CBS 386.78]
MFRIGEKKIWGVFLLLQFLLVFCSFCFVNGMDSSCHDEAFCWSGLAHFLSGVIGTLKFRNETGYSSYGWVHVGMMIRKGHGHFTYCGSKYLTVVWTELLCEATCRPSFVKLDDAEVYGFVRRKEVYHCFFIVAVMLSNGDALLLLIGVVSAETHTLVSSKKIS